ncbi:MAG: YdcF family protein [Pyrinomonadaceae bacterium]
MWLRGVFTKRRLIGLAVVIALWIFVAWLGARTLIVQAPLDHASALVVLGGSATYKERTELAARLFREGRAPLIILTDDGQKSDWSRTEGRNPLFVERARAELVRMGVPESAITILPGTVGSTQDEAEALRGFIFARGLRSLLIVTSAYHSRRALRTMRDGLSGTGVVVGLIAAPTGIQTPRPLLWWLMPTGWPLVAGEYVKMVYYRINYWK